MSGKYRDMLDDSMELVQTDLYSIMEEVSSLGCKVATLSVIVELENYVQSDIEDLANEILGDIGIIKREIGELIKKVD